MDQETDDNYSISTNDDGGSADDDDESYVPGSSKSRIGGGGGGADEYYLANSIKSPEYRILRAQYEWTTTNINRGNPYNVPKLMKENDFLELTMKIDQPNTYTVSLCEFDYIYPHFDLDVKRENISVSDATYRKILFDLINNFRAVLCTHFLHVSEDDIAVFTRSKIEGGVHVQIRNRKILVDYLREQLPILESLLNVKLFDRKTFTFPYSEVSIKLDHPSNVSLPGFTKTGKLNDCYRHIVTGHFEPFPYDRNVHECNIIEVRVPFELPLGSTDYEKLLIEFFDIMLKEGKTTMKLGDNILDFNLFSKIELYNQLSWKQNQIDYIIVLYFYNHCKSFTFDTYLWLCEFFAWTCDTFKSLEDIEKLANLLIHLEFIAQHHTFAPILLVMLLQIPNYWDRNQSNLRLNIKCMKSEYCSLNMIDMLREMNRERITYLTKLASLREGEAQTVVYKNQDNEFDSSSVYDDDSNNVTLESLMSGEKRRAPWSSTQASDRKRTKVTGSDVNKVDVKNSWINFLKAAETVLNKLFIAFERKCKDKVVINLWFFGKWQEFDTKFLSHIYGELLNLAVDDITVDNFNKAIVKNSQSWYAMRSHKIPSDLTLNFHDKIIFHIESQLFLPATVPLLVMNLPEFAVDSMYFHYGLNNSQELFEKYFKLLYTPLKMEEQKNLDDFSAARKITNGREIEQFYLIMLRYVFAYMSGNVVKMFTLLWYLARFALFRESKIICHWYGPLANNGKTFLLMSLRKPLGSYMNAISMSSVKNANKETHPDLVKASKGSIIYLDEGTSSQSDYNVQAIKALTSGSCQYIRSLYDDGGQKQFQFNFLTTGNSEFGSIDDAGFRTRLKTFPFNTVIEPQYTPVNCYNPSNEMWNESMNVIFKRHISFDNCNLTLAHIQEHIGLGFMVFFGMCENQAEVDKAFRLVLTFDAQTSMKTLMWKKIIPATGHHITLKTFSSALYDLLIQHYNYLPKKYFKFMHRTLLEVFQNDNTIQYRSNKFYNIQLKLSPTDD